MVVKFDNYHYGTQVVSLALSADVLNILLGEKKKSLFVHDGKAELSPEHLSFELSDETIIALQQCDNYDVFYISESGSAYKYYDNEREDNAFTLTTICNSNCVMCPASEYSRRNEGGIPIGDVLKIIYQMPSDPKHITITGGEPFLVGEHIFDVFSAFKFKCPNTYFLLLTNGRAFSYLPYVEKFNVTSPDRITIGIPLHGYDSQSHDYITRSPGGFKQTLAGIKNLLAYKHNVELRIVVNKLNSLFISNIAQLIVNEIPTVHRVEIMGLEMLGNAAKNCEQVWIPYPEAFKAAKGAVDFLVKNSIDVGLYNFPLCAVEPAYWYLCSKSITDYKVRFANNCSDCVVQDACCGIFAGTIRLAKDDVSPVVKEC